MPLGPYSIPQTIPEMEQRNREMDPLLNDRVYWTFDGRPPLPPLIGEEPLSPVHFSRRYGVHADLGSPRDHEHVPFTGQTTLPTFRIGGIPSRANDQDLADLGGTFNGKPAWEPAPTICLPRIPKSLRNALGLPVYEDDEIEPGKRLRCWG